METTKGQKMSDEPNIEDCTFIEGHDNVAGEGMDDGYSIALYKTAEGKNFIDILNSDYSSRFGASTGFYMWVADDQIFTWKDL